MLFNLELCQMIMLVLYNMLYKVIYNYCEAFKLTNKHFRRPGGTH